MRLNPLSKTSITTNIFMTFTNTKCDNSAISVLISITCFVVQLAFAVQPDSGLIQTRNKQLFQVLYTKRIFCWMGTYWSYQNYTSAGRQDLEGQYYVVSSLRHRFFKSCGGGDDDDDDDRNLYHPPQDNLSCVFTCMDESILLN